MALKRIIKFVLRLVVAAGIVVGAYFGITALFGGKNKANTIVNVARETKISTEAKASANNLYNQSSDYNLKIKITVMNDINNVLIEYFDYYVNISCYENHPNEAKRSEVENKIRGL